MTTKTGRKSRDRAPAAPRLRAVDEAGPRRPSCPTAVSVEALRTGVLPYTGRALRSEIPRGGDTIRVGDPDDHALANEYGGEETPGGSSSTPDQNEVDAIGRAYGLQEEDAGALRCASEILARRDRRRMELTPPRRRV
jgi:general stress protein YciG